MKKPQSVHIHEGNREKYWQMVPGDFKKIINTASFCASSVFARGKPVGLFYADCHADDGGVQAEDYAHFKKLCTDASRIISNMAGQPTWQGQGR